MDSYIYYNKYAQAFIDRTFELDLTHLTDGFLEHIPDGGRILDLGCGSGRDAKTFMEKGYEVYAVDASEAMVEHTRQYLGDRVSLSTFQDYETDMKFDGVWASASLLHVPEEEIIQVIRKYRDMLKSGGVFHMSFKDRPANFTQGERSFTCYDEARLRDMMGHVYEMTELKVFGTDSAVKEHVGERWVNGLFRRNKIEYWDIYDRSRNRTGRTALRGNDLEPGDYHLVVFGIIRNTDGRFLISKRAPEKTFAGSWEFTGGSAVKGDSSYEAVKREIEEETGLVVESEGRLLRSDAYEEHCSFFSDIWYFEEEVDLTKCVCQPGEVSEIRLATRDEIMALHRNGQFMPGHTDLYECFVELK